MVADDGGGGDVAGVNAALVFAGPVHTSDKSAMFTPEIRPGLLRVNALLAKESLTEAEVRLPESNFQG